MFKLEKPDNYKYAELAVVLVVVHSVTMHLQTYTFVALCSSLFFQCFPSRCFQLTVKIMKSPEWANHNESSNVWITSVCLDVTWVMTPRRSINSDADCCSGFVSASWGRKRQTPTLVRWRVAWKRHEGGGERNLRRLLEEEHTDTHCTTHISWICLEAVTPPNTDKHTQVAIKPEGSHTCSIYSIWGVISKVGVVYFKGTSLCCFRYVLLGHLCLLTWS